MPDLDVSMFKPEPSESTAAEIVAATIDFAAKAREAYNLAADRVLIFAVPYDPPMRESWKQAELALRRDGHKIKFAWDKWDVWTVPRSALADLIPTEWHVYPADQKASVPSWVAQACMAAGHADRGSGPRPLNTHQLHTLAAECLAMADYLDADHSTL